MAAEVKVLRLPLQAVRLRTAAEVKALWLPRQGGHRADGLGAVAEVRASW